MACSRGVARVDCEPTAYLLIAADDTGCNSGFQLFSAFEFFVIIVLSVATTVQVDMPGDCTPRPAPLSLKRRASGCLYTR